MPALVQDRNTPHRENVDFTHPVAAAQKIYAGSIVMRDTAGNAVKGAPAAGQKALGVAQEQADNTGGAAGAIDVRVRLGAFRFANDGTVTRADIGRLAYVVDDQTVAGNDNVGARSALGAILDVDAVGVWVDVGANLDLTATANLDFPAIAAAASSDLTIPVPGAAVGDGVSLGLPAAPTAGLIFQGFVSAADVVTVRATNITAAAIDAAAATIRATVHK